MNGNHLNTIGVICLMGSWLFFFIVGHMDGRKWERLRNGSSE